MTDRLDLWRQAASDDEQDARYALEDLLDGFLHQGTVSVDAASAVPCLLDLVAVAAHHRSWSVFEVGIMADPDHADPGLEQDEVLEAIRRHRDRFVSLLQDSDADVRAAAAYTLGRIANVPALLDRWATEDDPKARAAIVLGLGELLPSLSRAAVEEAPLVRVAAAVAVARAGRTLPDGCTDALERAYAEDPDLELPFPLTRHGEALVALVGRAVLDDAVDLVHRLVGARAARVRRQAIWAIGERCEKNRSAPDRLVAFLAGVLDDEDPDVRLSAVRMAWQSGRSARMHADTLAAIAGAYPSQVSDFRVTAPGFAIRTLARLGDPRWLEPVAQALLAGRDVSGLDLHPGNHPYSSLVLHEADAMREHHSDNEAVAQWLTRYVSGWEHARRVEPSTEDDVAELLRLVDPFSGEAALAQLVRLRATHALPQLRQLVEQETPITGSFNVVGQALWFDERLVDLIRDAIAALEASADPPVHES